MSALSCDFSKGACINTLSSGTEITLDISPKPLTAMSELQFSVMINKDRVPVSNAAVTVDLTMPGMYMGGNIVRLTPVKDNLYEGTGIIPICSSGAKKWMAEVTVKVNNSIYSASYIFTLN